MCALNRPRPHSDCSGSPPNQASSLGSRPARPRCPRNWLPPTARRRSGHATASAHGPWARKRAIRPRALGPRRTAGASRPNVTRLDEQPAHVRTSSRLVQRRAVASPRAGAREPAPRPGHVTRGHRSSTSTCSPRRPATASGPLSSSASCRAGYLARTAATWFVGETSPGAQEHRSTVPRGGTSSGHPPRMASPPHRREHPERALPPRSHRHRHRLPALGDRGNPPAATYASELSAPRGRSHPTRSVSATSALARRAASTLSRPRTARRRPAGRGARLHRP